MMKQHTFIAGFFASKRKGALGALSARRLRLATMLTGVMNTWFHEILINGQSGPEQQRGLASHFH